MEKLQSVKVDKDIEWLQTYIKVGDTVQRGDIIGVYKITESEEIKDLISIYTGDVHAIHVKANEKFKKDAELLRILEPCGHDVQLGGLCAVCGKDVGFSDFLGNESARANFSMVHDNVNLKVSEEEAKRIEALSAKELYKDKKLILLVDLDQTILHATPSQIPIPWVDDATHPNYQYRDEIFSFMLPENPGAFHLIQGLFYYIKLRPYLDGFFRSLKDKFEMHIYTMGTRNYALNIVKKIDPDGSLFGDRILTRDENAIGSKKSIARLFPKNSHLVIIIDDRPDVWDWCDNLISVRPYSFFMGTKDINDPNKIMHKIDLEGINNDQVVEEECNELEFVSRILLTVHSKIYDHKEKDVKDCLNNIRRPIFKNLKIAFSGINVVNNGIPTEETYHGKLTQMFGGTTSDVIDRTVTHLVALKNGTEKVIKAMQNRTTKVVNHDWFLDSVFHYEKRDESNYIFVSNIRRSSLSIGSDGFDFESLDLQLTSPRNSVELFAEMNKEIDEALDDSDDYQENQEGDDDYFDEEEEGENDDEIYDEKLIEPYLEDDEDAGEGEDDPLEEPLNKNEYGIDDLENEELDHRKLKRMKNDSEGYEFDEAPQSSAGSQVQEEDNDENDENNSDFDDEEYCVDLGRDLLNANQMLKTQKP